MKKMMVLFFIILQAGLISISSCSKDEEGPKDINGNWLVTCTITSCYQATVSKVIPVSDGSFNAEIGSYSLYGQTETVSIQGTFEVSGNNSYAVSGNQFLVGSACNGGNGFYGFINTDNNPMTGDPPSSWGTIHWEKQ